MPQTTQEEVEITALIRGILNGYPGNSAILREYLQNSDDAKASKQVFIIDERTHPSEFIIDPALKEAQGPALITYNDGVLRLNDWKALRTIHSSSKQADDGQTGKNGLGFRASYHLTDNPHVLSRQTLMILDPHHAFVEHPGGVSIDIVKEGAAYKDQLVAFNSVSQDEGEPLSGTAFRLPFRTPCQASGSKISDKVTHVAEFLEMLRNFVSNELESVILFLKHIISIEVRRIDAQGKEWVLGKVEIDGLDPTPHSGQIHRKVTLTTEDGTSSTRTWCFHNHRIEKDAAAQRMSSRLGYDIGEFLVQEKLAPGVDIAFPLEGPNVKGGLFTLLPLPINIPGSSFHVNANFALTPDRQNLKKKQEVGDIHSRERRLVEWNTVILDEWAPVVWAKALSDLDPKNLLSRGWSAWPPEERDPDSYWFRLAREVTNQIVEHNAPIFPTHDLQHLVSRNSALFIHSTDNKAALFAILSRFGVHIVRPPPQIFSALETIVNNFQDSTLSPRSLHNLLCNSIAKTSGLPLDVKSVHQVMEYLALTSTPPTLDLLSNLPWFSRTDGSLVSLTSPPTTTRWIMPKTEEEAQLFTDDPRMLSRDCVSENLRIHLLKAETATILNVTTLTVELVSAFLDSRFSILDGLPDELPDLDEMHHVDWLIQFWAWVARWSSRELFFRTQIGKIQHLHLLPTSHKTLRKMSSQIIIFQNVPQAAVKVWGTLGVHGLHDSIPRDAVSILKDKTFAVAQGTSGFVSLLMKTYDMNCQPVLDQTSLIHIRNSLTLGLRLEAEPRFSPQEIEKLLKLQVFMVRHHPGERSILGPASGTAKFVKAPDDFPLPRLAGDNVVYIDMEDFATESLIKLVNRNGLKVLLELDILKLAIDHWDLQPMDFQDRVIEKIFENRRYTSALRNSLKTLNFVTVNQVSHRVQPRGLIYPMSGLADLYEGEPGRIPTGKFSSADYLVVMQSEGFLDFSLNESIVQERLEYFKSASSQEKSIARKATTFIQILNKFWEPSYKPFILRERSTEWFPCDGLSLAAPDQCRDSHRGPHEHPYYYDLCLRVLYGDVVSAPGLRSALGWSDAIPSHILVEQLRLTLEQGTNSNGNRLIKLLNYLGQLHSDSNLVIEVVEDLKKIVGGKPWIPVMAGPTGSFNLATCKHAVLSESELRPPFRRVDPQFKHLRFLLVMGCTLRPTFEALIEELRKWDITVNSAGRILEEIAFHHPDFDRGLVMVPDVTGRMCPIESVYYRDTNVIDLTGEISQKSPIHNIISRSIAEAIGIPFASSLTLGEDDDDDEQMSEDLVGRIRGFLREYDSRYAMNEFLANADDAGATDFSILLDGGDSRERWKQRLIAPAFESVQGSPSLVLYNNSTLSDEDFKGLLRVGRGGKVELSDTHGRHGLGALSFYYFTDVVTVISRDTVLILDPSSKYLPPRRHGQKRTSLTRKFGDIARSYPDQFKSYSDFGFSPLALPHFNGTIFILPLSSSIAERPSNASSTLDLMKGSYRELSQNAFFFTKLEKISAAFLSCNGSKYLWRLSTTRFSILSSENHLSGCTLDVDGVKEDWLIATSDKTPIPTDHNATALGLKLQLRSPMKVQLAIRTTLSDGKEPESYLFSTLRLPKTTSLPFHLDSRFAISSNRQSIVFDPADGRNNRDSKTSFNLWILEQLVPPLYLSAIEHLLHTPSNSSRSRFDSKRWWLSEPPDEISAVVGAAFARLLPVSNNLLFKSVDGQWIPFRDAVFSLDESRCIRNILRLLKAPGFVSAYRSSKLTKVDSAKILDTNFVKQVLLNHATLGTLQTWYNEGKISDADIHGILEYVASDAPLIALPLLILSTGKLVQIPGAQTSTVYVSPYHSHAVLFSSSLFLARGYSKEVVGHLQMDSSISVVALSSQNIATLITAEISRFTTDEELNAWLDLLWEHYSSLPKPQSLEFLENTSLKIVKTNTKNLSLPECSPKQVIYDMAAIKGERLASITKKLGIDVIEVDTKSVIGQYLSKRFSDTKLIVNLLLCLQEKSITSFDSLTAAEHNHLASWLQQNIYQNLWVWRRRDPDIQKSFLLRLSIWSIYLDQREQRLAASGVSVLPSNFPVEDLRSYLKQGRSVASHSSELVGLLEYCGYSKPGEFASMSAREILSAVSLPTKLENSSDFDLLESFIRSILRLPTEELKQANLKLPANDGTLQYVNELYDNTVSLFEKTLKYTLSPSFLHNRLRNLIRGGLNLHTLRSLGMTYNVDLASFKYCALEIQRLSDQSQHDQSELFEMSRCAFNSYQEELPRQLMTDKERWDSLENIAFIRPKEDRRQGVSYDWRRYFVSPLPAVLAPSQFVRPSLESIAWTQRPLCFYEPTAGLLAVNATFGVPQVSEVVEHLKVLTTRIAQDHPGDRTLLSDIQATYKWLDDHSEEAKVPLSSARHLKLFLNVNDPTEHEWAGQWETAQNIVLNLHYDYEHLKTAREFLLKYDKLLRAAGCSSMKIFNRAGHEPAPVQSESDNQRSREVQNEMRKSGVLTDMIFVPTSRNSGVPMGADDSDGDGISEGGSECTDGANGGVEPDSNILEDVEVVSLELRAHRLVLAAAIPYFRDLATGWKVDNTVEDIPFYGSAFGAKLLLDYVYTGDFDFSSGLPVSMDEVARLLRDFLELMQIADEWNMQSLKEKLEWNIIHKFDMVQRLPHANQMMLEEAERYNAMKLKEALVEFAKHNGTVLDVLQKDE